VKEGVGGGEMTDDGVGTVHAIPLSKSAYVVRPVSLELTDFSSLQRIMSAGPVTYIRLQDLRGSAHPHQNSTDNSHIGFELATGLNSPGPSYRVSE
jgi:hypothetical protein